jgi:hypothetical protein
MLSLDEYNKARREIDEKRAWIDTKRVGKSGWASYRQEDVPAHLQHVDNDLTSAVEFFEWVTVPPRSYFLYINEANKTATTWTGEVLGSVEFGRKYVSNMGDTRVPIVVRGNNGVVYHGMYYKSAGDYARILAYR